MDETRRRGLARTGVQEDVLLCMDALGGILSYSETDGEGLLCRRVLKIFFPAKQPLFSFLRYSSKDRILQPLRNSILTVLAYFDMFRYPLRWEEIHGFLDQPAEPAKLVVGLNELVLNGQVFTQEGFYQLQNDHSRIERRLEGNRRAEQLLPAARRIAKLLYRFPFVRGTGISGSLSKCFADKEADMDFFIITAPGRLWIARTLLHLLKKVSFLFGKQHWFCMNYFISSDALLIGERNIFTATEVVTLIPVCGQECFRDFFAVNAWANKFYPMADFSECVCQHESRHPVKRLLEKCLSGKKGEWLDNRWMQQTTDRWNKKMRDQHINKKGELMGLKTGKEYARPAPELFQKKILDLFREKTKHLHAIPAAVPAPIPEIIFS